MGNFVQNWTEGIFKSSPKYFFTFATFNFEDSLLNVPKKSLIPHK